MTGSQREFDPRDLIDRQAEQELFHQLVSFVSPARLLTISDRGGTGKSSLLKRLLYNSRWQIKPAIPACLIELDRIEAPAPFQFVAQVVEGLNIRDRFAKFEQLNTARLDRNFAAFTQGDDALFGDQNVQATAVAEGSLGGVVIYSDEAFSIQNREFTKEQEQFARQKCVEAFFEDLRTIYAAEPVVIMLDAWERCNLELRQWIRDEFLAKHCFNPDRSLRPDKLAIVVASRPYDPAITRQGLRPDEFRPLFRDEHDYKTTVLSVKSLSVWGKEHVSAFMVSNGYTQASEDEINFIQAKLNAGWSLEKILSVISVLKSITPEDDTRA